MTDEEIIKHACSGHFDVLPYSGRGMYNRQCLGVWGDLLPVLAAIAELAPTPEDASRIILETKYDSPVVYWPNVPCSEPTIDEITREIAKAEGCDYNVCNHDDEGCQCYCREKAHKYMESMHA